MRGMPVISAAKAGEAIKAAVATSAIHRFMLVRISFLGFIAHRRTHDSSHWWPSGIRDYPILHAADRPPGVEVRPDVSATFAARLACEARFQIG
jgi:hypothetical protein